MKTYKILSVFIIIFYLNAGHSFAKNNNKIIIEKEPAVIIGGFKITISDAIKKAIESNHDILSGSYDVAMSDSAYQKFQKKYSIFLNGDIGAKYEKYPEALAMLAGKDKKSINTTASIFKMFSTGTSVAGGIKHEYAKSTFDSMQIPVFDFSGNAIGQTYPLAFGDDNYHRPILFVKVQQELLKNSFGYSEKRIGKILKNATKIQREVILFKLSMVVVGVIAQYWDVVVKKTSVDNAMLQLKETKRVRNIIARNVRLGLVDSYNNNYYNTLYAYAEAKVLKSNNDYKISLRKFLSIIDMDSDIEITGSAILSDQIPKIKIEAALKTAYAKRADYKAALLTVKNAKLEYEINCNNNLPSLTAEISASSMAQEDGLGSSYAGALKLENPSIEARLRISYPLFDAEQKINIRNAKYKLKKAKINLKKVRRYVKDDVVTKYENIINAKNIYLKIKKTRIESGKFYRKMLTSMRRGRLSAAIIKNGLDAMVSSRQNELQAIIYFNITLLQFDVSKNMLFEKFKIDVDRYIPGTKKYLKKTKIKTLKED